jgi:hypothetical protein
MILDDGRTWINQTNRISRQKGQASIGQSFIKSPTGCFSLQLSHFSYEIMHLELGMAQKNKI